MTILMSRSHFPLNSSFIVRVLHPLVLQVWDALKVLDEAGDDPGSVYVSCVALSKHFEGFQD